eukprot:2764352-Pyramimonas_sp.AAC.1
MTVVDDRGYQISLGLTSPKLLETLCKGAFLRSLERDLGGKWDVGKRLCLDIPKSACSSKKFTPAQLGWIRACTSCAIWTADRALSAGCDVDPLCPGCRAAPDSIAHRLWSCLDEE